MHHIRVTPDAVGAAIQEQDKQFRNSRGRVITIPENRHPLVIQAFAGMQGVQSIAHGDSRNTERVTQILNRQRGRQQILTHCS